MLVFDSLHVKKSIKCKNQVTITYGISYILLCLSPHENIDYLVGLHLVFSCDL